MAGTITLYDVAQRGMDAWGKYAIAPFSYVGPASYVTGGETLVPNKAKLGLVELMFGGFGIATTGAATAVWFVWNPSTLKIQAFWGNAGSASALPEVDSTTDLSDYKAQFIALGRG